VITQKTTENFLLLAFIMPGRILPEDEGGDDPKDNRKPYSLGIRYAQTRLTRGRRR
jgi:hypothetical protein